MTSTTNNSDMVLVLLSTYNGSKFLRQQLDSLYQQTYPNIKILVRDDGSTDTTLELLQAEKSKGSIELLNDQNNLGATCSFFELLRHTVLSETGYVAFCDQDDVWSPDKIECAVSALSVCANRPALYCSRLEIVDEQLNHITLTRIPEKIGFGNAVVENIAVGCTTVLNKKALNILCNNLPKSMPFHDWWCYLVISCFGEVIFDSCPRIQYRLHGKNVVGAATTEFEAIKRKLTRLITDRVGISEQIEVFLNIFGDRIPMDHRQLLNLFINAKKSYGFRIRLIFSKQIWRQKWLDNIVLRFVFLIGRI